MAQRLLSSPPSPNNYQLPWDSPSLLDADSRICLGASLILEFRKRTATTLRYLYGNDSSKGNRSKVPLISSASRQNPSSCWTLASPEGTNSDGTTMLKIEQRIVPRNAVGLGGDVNEENLELRPQKALVLQWHQRKGKSVIYRPFESAPTSRKEHRGLSNMEGAD